MTRRTRTPYGPAGRNVVAGRAPRRDGRDVQPVSQLVRVAASLDAQGRGPLGDAAAAAFGLGAATFRRSSATHVFVTDAAVLRVLPDAPGVRERADEVAAWTAGLHASGAPVVRPLAAPDGSWTAALAWDGGLWWATAQARVPGGTVAPDDLGVHRARRWGGCLAAFHDAGAALLRDGWPVPSPSPVWPAAERASWPVDDLVLVHGDAEPDNVVWDGDRLVLVDLDELGAGTRESDLVAALREWAVPGSPPDLGHPLVQAFLDGYRRACPAGVGTNGFARLAEAHEVALRERLAPVVTDWPSDGWPGWAHDLHARLVERAGPPAG